MKSHVIGNGLEGVGPRTLEMMTFVLTHQRRYISLGIADHKIADQRANVFHVIKNGKM